MAFAALAAAAPLLAAGAAELPAVAVVTSSVVPDVDGVGFVLEAVDCWVLDALVSWESKVSAEGDGETALIDMITSLPWDRPSGISLSATAVILFSRLCQKVVGRGNSYPQKRLTHQE